jgi:WD40 repeat protein
MKHVFCIAMGLLLVAGNVQAAEVPFVEFKGYGSVIFSPDYKNVLTNSTEGTVQIWDVETGKELRTLEGPAIRIRSMRFSPDGKSILIARNDYITRIWDTESGKELRALEGYIRPPWRVPRAMRSFGFSPDGKRIVATNENGSAICIWDAESGILLRTLPSDAGSSARFSRDGTRLIVSIGARRMGEYRATRILDAESGMELHQLEGYPISDFSQGTKKLITEDAKKTTRIWDAESGKELLAVTGRNSDFSPDGRKLVTTLNDTARVWDLSTMQW